MTPKHHELTSDESATSSPGDLSVRITTGNSAKALATCAKDPSAPQSDYYRTVLSETLRSNEDDI